MGTNILAYGEVTGHSHKLIGGKVLKRDKQLYVQVEDSAELVHQEHRSIYLPQGLYEVVRQQEYEAGIHQGRILQD